MSPRRSPLPATSALLREGCRSRARRTAADALLVALLLAPGPSLRGQSAAPVTSAELAAFRPRVIGPAHTGGRVHDVEALPGDPSTIWVATASGGLWKTTNRGHTWAAVFDTMAVSTFGDVAVAPSDPDVVYAGTGEQNNRQSTSWGAGVWRTDDGGATWRHLGLEDTRHIGKIEVDPGDPDVAYVAALGNLWAPGPDRGVYRTRDGGATWERVLEVDPYTGAVDLVMDPSDPDVLYAATYQRLRRAWGFNGGGPGSGIYRTGDGGETWRKLGGGLPSGDLGRIGLAIGRSDPRVVMATVQTPSAGTTGTYRSEDAGATWTRVNPLDPRPMYYSEIFLDPTDAERVYVLGTTSWRSDDGGRTFDEIASRPAYDVGVHADHHALWIDPGDPEHLYLAGDAGLHESYDGGRNFRKLDDIPIGQFYSIAVDLADPYRVYGGMQDNHSWMGPSETRSWAGILDDDWRQTGFGDGMYWDTDPSDPGVAYGSSNDGSYFRLDVRTGDMLDITPAAPPGEEPYRFDWTSPLMASRHRPGTVYVAGNRLFISRDRGVSWTRTPDLSRGIDRDTLELMGVPGREIGISRDDGTGSFGEAVTLDESPVDPDVLWVGFDDGNLQVSEDGGVTWREVSGFVPGLPPGTYVSRIEASARGAGVAYAAFDAHRDGDFSPYLYRTEDMGRTWTPLVSGLPPGAGSLNVVLEQPDRPETLFLGSEHHLFVSTDVGTTWARFPGLPTTAYDDLVIHPREKDLVIGTHGRSIWIVDDTRPLAEWDARAVSAPAHLFSVAPGTLFQYWKDTSYRGDSEWQGTNPEDGVAVTYRLGPGQGPATLRVTGPDGREVRVLDVPAGPGLHRVTWDLRHGTGDGPDVWHRFEDPRLARSVEARGPFVSPGTFTVTLEARGERVSRPVEVRGDPLLPEISAADYRARETFLLEALAVATDARQVRARLEAATRVDGARTGELAGLARRLGAAASEVQRAYRDLNGGDARQGSLHRPTRIQLDRLAEAREALARARRALDAG